MQIRCFRKVKPEFPVILRRILFGWLLAVLVEYLLLPESFRSLSGLTGLTRMSLLRVMLLTFLTFFLLTAFSDRWKCPRAERWGMVGLFAALVVLALRSSFTWPFLAACILLLAILVVYAARGWDGSLPCEKKAEKTNRAALKIVILLSLLFFLFLTIWTVCRVYSFRTPTFDFGIFAQMFHSMKTTGMPNTTVERDGLLSHFQVHVSPIYYLLLPFYLLAPAPATLQVLQAAVLTSAVIPLWKLGKIHGLGGWQRLLLCAMLFLYPAYSGGVSYDIHENCFLTPLILWLFYGIDQKKTGLMAWAAVLLLMVKEDAAVYVAVIALWLLVKAWLARERWGVTAGSVLLAAAVGYFLAVTGYLANLGDGVMTYRYKNFLFCDSASLLTVVQAVLLSPMKAVYECVDPEKLFYLAMTLLPLFGLPLLTRRYERFLLWIPYLLVNLMPDYGYQHDIFFQYTFGSAACLFYLALVNLADLRIPWKRLTALAAAFLISAVAFGAVIVPKAVPYPRKCIEERETYQNIRRLLAQIPAEASVSATTFYTTPLSGREVLYDICHTSREHLLSTEYIVLNPTTTDDFQKYGTDGETGYAGLIRLLEENDYTLLAEIEGWVVIYQKSAP